MPVPADDDVIVHCNAERLGDGNDLPRHVDVGARRSGVAGGMVVDEAMAMYYLSEKKEKSLYATVRWDTRLGAVPRDAA
jgi:hypothetical protein